MQILTIRKGFEAFECNFCLFEMDSKHSNANSNHSKEIRRIQMQIWTIWKEFEHLNQKSNHLKGIRNIWEQIGTVRKGFEALECKL